MRMNDRRVIRIRGLSLHNLRHIDLDIPLGRLVVVTGVSGAGKSSLVFDSIYAESQRRFIETFSPYARQFLERLPRPPAEEIENLPAAVAIEQKNPVKNARSTVGTLAELNWPARLLFYYLADLICPDCGAVVQDNSPGDVVRYVRSWQQQSEGTLLMTVSVPMERCRAMLEQGWFRCLRHGRVERLDSCPEDPGIESIEFVIDRFKSTGALPSRISESAEQAFSLGDGRVFLVEPGKERVTFSRGMHCASCNRDFQQPAPSLFSFNSSVGACPVCTGFGRIQAIDRDLVVPDPSLSIAQGAVKPLETRARWKARLLAACSKASIDVHSPWRELSEEQKEMVFSGFGNWRGVDAFFAKLERKRYKPHIRMLLARYRTYLPCPSCKGARFRQETLWYRLAGLRLPEFYDLTIRQAIRWCQKVRRYKNPDEATGALLDDLEYRLDTLCRAGLHYLSMSRASRTLSGGEAARINMARALGARLSNTLYCIDEPSTGLHAVDSRKIVRLLYRLVRAGNTVLVVDNAPQIVSAAQQVIELGPGSGTRGGRVTYQGTPPRLEGVSEQNPCYGSSGHGRQTLVNDRFLDGYDNEFISVSGVSQHNLRSIDVRFPLHAVSCISGVSGSGKSTLAEDVLFRAVSRKLGNPCEKPGEHTSLNLPSSITFCELVDQSAPSRTPRACPATALKIFDIVRKLFASCPEAVSQGFGPGVFSFNTEDGRCRECAGQGSRTVEMQFLPDFIVPCPECGGSRFNLKVLSVRYRNKNIADCLDMTIEDALEFFGDLPAFGRRVKPALQLGLGHLKLGQPLSMLSAGEIQRLKLAGYLQKSTKKGEGLFILDEPTRGLHASEVSMLVAALDELASRGHTVIIVEHDLQVIARSHWVVDLGPGGGTDGGRVVYQGSPAGMGADSVTGRMLQEILASRDFGQVSVRDEVSEYSSGPNDLESSNHCIRIRGARHHNLKNISLDIPHNRIVVITGVSGSGKSTLAFDCIFSEGQRRYMEGLSSYMRQFVTMYQRPDVDCLEGLTPSVAIEQRTSRAGSMSTVATLTETAHYLRLLYAKAAEPWCIRCDMSMKAMSAREIAQEVVSKWEGEEFFVAVPRVIMRKGQHALEFEQGIRSGIELFRVDGKVCSAAAIPRLGRYQEHSIFWILGSIRLLKENIEHIEELVGRAAVTGRGMVSFVPVKDESGCRELVFSTVHACPKCHKGAREPDPLLFSFSTRAGRCRECGGSGKHDNGAACSACKGSRLNEEARSWRIGGFGIDAVFNKEIGEALSLMNSWLEQPPWSSGIDKVARGLVENVSTRLAFLVSLGLDYLPLDFSGDALSGGEAQRIRLAAQAGSGLCGVTVVLDEPTIGLHPRDNRRLIEAFRRLRDAGNSVIVVEHDEDTLRAADWLIDLGPGGGTNGGRVVAQGTTDEIVACKESATGAALRSAERRRLNPARVVKSHENMMVISGARCRNLKGFEIRVPRSAVTVITGVSGAGKSTLAFEVLAPALANAIHGNDKDNFANASISGHEGISRVVTVDHSPIGRTPRSCPATYIGVWTEIRNLLARVPQARGQGFGPGRFSFNLEGGRCSACKGQGSIRVTLGYLPDVFVPCEQCNGLRFEPATLDIKWKGRSVADILSMTIEEAREFFRAVPRIHRYLAVTSELGLGYLTLGQPAPTLSGGEAQRLKLARELASGRCENTLYLLDEPTTGLHINDVSLLIRHLKRLAARGSTVVVIEHNMDVIAASDWLIDLGPEGGKRGGNLLFCGTPSEFVEAEVASETRIALEEYLV